MYRHLYMRNFAITNNKSNHMCLDFNYSFIIKYFEMNRRIYMLGPSHLLIQVFLFGLVPFSLCYKEVYQYGHYSPFFYIIAFYGHKLYHFITYFPLTFFFSISMSESFTLITEKHINNWFPGLGPFFVHFFPGAQTRFFLSRQKNLSCLLFHPLFTYRVCPEVGNKVLPLWRKK